MKTNVNGRKKQTNTHQSLQRAVAIMRAFSEQNPALSVTEISNELNLHKSTVSRILTALLHEELVWHNEETGKYSLGLGLVSLAGVALGQVNVRAAALPQMEQLVAQSGETATLSLLRGQTAVAIADIPSPQSIRYVVWIGRQIPLHCTASGKILLAFASAETQSTLLRGPLPTYTPQTITDLPQLRQQLAQVRRQGIVTEIDEFEHGTTAVAAPIFGFDGQLRAAVSIAGPSFRLQSPRLQTFIHLLQSEALAISEKLGFSGSYPFA